MPIWQTLSGKQAERPVKSTPVAVSLTGTGTTNILNVTGERGVLKGLSARITTSITGTPTVAIEITIDGTTTLSLSFFAAGVVFQSEAAAYMNWNTGVAVAANLWAMDFNLPYRNSCVVAINVSGVASAGAQEMTTVRHLPIAS